MSPESTRVPSTHSQRTHPEAPECAASPANDIYPESPRVRRVSRVPQPGEFLRKSPSLPPVPECRSRKPTPDAPGCATCPPPRDPSRELPKCAAPRETPHRETLPDTFRVRRAPETPHRVITPEHS